MPDLPTAPNGRIDYASRAIRIGLIVPASNTNVEPDCALLAPEGVTIHSERTGGYDPRVVPDSGEMRRFVSTMNTARDMDVIRGALGEKKVSYVGYSYGTQLGAVFGSMFPKSLDRSVLERIAYLFLHLHDRLEMLGLAENGSFQLPITQQQLADTLGMSLVHTNKTLKRLLARELVTWRNGTCTIVDRQALADIAHYDGDLPRRRRPLI